MTINYTTNLSLAEPVTGTESGTWGDDVNKGLTDYLDIAIAGTLALTSSSFTANALTLANTTGNNTSNGITTTTAQYYVLKVSSLAANVTITAPSSSKSYIVANLDSTYSVTIKASGQTGITVPAGQRALVVYNGTDYVQVGASAGGANTQVQYNNAGALAGSANFTFNGTTATINTLNLTNALGPTYGGTNQSTYTTGDILYSSATNTLSKLGIGSTNQVLTVVGGVPAWAANSGTPGGSNTQIQFNNSGSFAGSASLTWDGSSVTAPQHIASNGLMVNNQTIGTSYSIPLGYAASSVGPVTLSGGVSVTVPSGSRWVVL